MLFFIIFPSYPDNLRCKCWLFIMWSYNPDFYNISFPQNILLLIEYYTEYLTNVLFLSYIVIISPVFYPVYREMSIIFWIEDCK